MADATFINDPVYGFTRIPRGLLTDVISHPYFQRLGRIRQLGMSALVYPGAQHTRFQHSLGALHLMQEAVHVLMEKGQFMFDAEVEAAETAILLHDVGHGPFSHVLEGIFARNLSHEEISLRIMERMNSRMDGRLSLALKVFRGEYGARYLHELISSQIDVDRLDYLSRDSFFTGVREGSVGAARIIKMMEISDDRLVVNAKGLYSVENYLMSRRVMYWQVYLHKTVVAAEEVLRQALRRAKWLAEQGRAPFAPPALAFFFDSSGNETDPELWLDHYVELEDNDILSAIKEWCHDEDAVLSRLADSFTHRRLFRVEVSEEPFAEEYVARRREEVASALALSNEDVDYFVRTTEVSNALYRTDTEGISLLFPDGSLRDVSEVSPVVRACCAAPPDRKFYLFTPRL
ncbi:MAG: HD domain-containing protein [Alloprevotella sp.]|nr:HD domain-containing protein [Alloprevotella sp.]